MSLSRKKTISYSEDFILSLRDKYQECPESLKELVESTLKEKGTSSSTNLTANRNGKKKLNRNQHSHHKKNHPHSSHQNSHTNSHQNSQSKRDWENLNDIRTICNSKSSFTNRMKELNEDQKFLGIIRGLLNKITDKTFEKIKKDIEELEIDEEYSKIMTEPIANIYLKKVECDSVYTELYSQSGTLLCAKFDNLSESIENQLKITFDELTKDIPITDLKKVKLINIMKWIPHGCNEKIINLETTNKNVIDVILNKIMDLTKDEHLVQSYVGAISSEDVAVWIEMACAILEVCTKKKETIENYDVLLKSVSALKDQPKKVKPRIRFMIEDLIELINKNEN